MTEGIGRASLALSIEGYLDALCTGFSNRHAGSPGNQAATDFFGETLRSSGFRVSTQDFRCLDWEPGEAVLRVGDRVFSAHTSPYSLPFRGSAVLVQAGEMAELRGLDCQGKILLLHGELAREQLVPKSFPFHIPVSHPELPLLLEEKAPAAILAATGRNPELAGASYPFPLIEDGDFTVPSVYTTDIEGARLLECRGGEAFLSISSNRIPSKGCNVRGFTGDPGRDRLVFCAHIDAKKGTPGALDNASGVSVLLGLAELLKGFRGNRCVELLALNGEDYYAASGQAAYMALPRTELDGIGLAVNLDLVGYRKGRTGFSFYQCPDDLAESARRVFLSHPGLYEGESWYQGDHMIFVSRNRPAMALVSEEMQYLCSEITHTEHDVPELVDCEKLADIALALRELVSVLSS
jgi:aminopeptidase YwaD